MDTVESRVLFTNGKFALVNKRIGELCSSPKNTSEEALYIPTIFASYFLKQYPGLDSQDFECVNRIDRPVSGVVILALTSDANKKLSYIVKKHKNIEKEYWAIVEGVFENSNEPVVLNQLISYNPKVQKAFIEKESRNGALPALLSYRIFGQGTNYSYVAIKLLTGRTHQIRCQLASQGLHIKGDLKYGAKRSEKNGGIRLHAAKFSLIDPYSDTQISVEAPLPYQDSLWMSFLTTMNGIS